MAIQNINVLQNTKDFAYLTKFENNATQYMYDALANLGQRFSVKGDSIITKSFTIRQLISNIKNQPINDDLDAATSFAKISVNSNKTLIQIYKYKNSKYIVDGEQYNPINYEPITNLTTEIEYTYKNIVYANQDLILDSKINGIDYYRNNSILLCDNENGCFYSSVIGCDNEIGIVELDIDKYDINENKLLSSLKVIDVNANTLNNSDSDGAYLMFKVDLVNNEEKNNSQYKIEIYKISSNLIIEQFGSFSTFILALQTTYINEYYNIYNTINIEHIFWEIKELGFEQYLFDGQNKSSEIINTENVYNNLHTLQYDSSNNLVVTIEFSNSNYYNLSLNSIINFINNQIVYLYPFLFEYYCDYVYRINNNQLKLQILYNMFNQAYEESQNNNETIVQTHSVNDFSMLIPIDYTFTYYCKDKDEYYIYSNESPISIKYILVDSIETLYNIDKWNRDVIICNHVYLDFVRLYKFYINYNNINSNIINSITFEKMYTTPYIANDYWIINDIPSKFKATGKDAGNPNIILVYSSGGIKSNNTESLTNYEILSDTNKELLQTFTWYAESTPITFTDIITKDLSNDIVNIYVANPGTVNIDNDKINLLENALLFNISSIQNIDLPNNSNDRNKLINIFGNNATITTIWKFNSSERKFKIIPNPNNNKACLTLDNLSNINNLVESTVQTYIKTVVQNDNYKYSRVIFDNANAELKQTDDTSFIYPIIYNEPYSTWKEYITAKLPNIISNNSQFTNVTEEKNDLNLLFKFVKIPSTTNIISYNYSTAISLPHYITDFNNITTNNNLALYRYSIVKNNSEIEDKIYDYIPAQDIPTINFSEVLINDINTINRINVISFSYTSNDKNSKPNKYYSYIGTSWKDEDKSTLHIGTYTTNLNLGEETLCQPKALETLSTHNKISIDFDNVTLNSKITETNNIFGTNHDNIKSFDYDLYIKSSDINELPAFITLNNLELQYMFCSYDDSLNNRWVSNILNSNTAKIQVNKSYYSTYYSYSSTYTLNNYIHSCVNNIGVCDIRFYQGDTDIYTIIENLENNPERYKLNSSVFNNSRYLLVSSYYITTKLNEITLSNIIITKSNMDYIEYDFSYLTDTTDKDFMNMFDNSKKCHFMINNTAINEDKYYIIPKQEICKNTYVLPLHIFINNNGTNVEAVVDYKTNYSQVKLPFKINCSNINDVTKHSFISNNTISSSEYVSTTLAPIEQGTVSTTPAIG